MSNKDDIIPIQHNEILTYYLPIYENKKDKTLIIISHRNNTVKYCDSIYVMEGGKIIDNGPFEQIIKKHSYLKETAIT